MAKITLGMIVRERLRLDRAIEEHSKQIQILVEQRDRLLLAEQVIQEMEEVNLEADTQ